MESLPDAPKRFLEQNTEVLSVLHRNVTVGYEQMSTGEICSLSVRAGGGEGGQTF